MSKYLSKCKFLPKLNNEHPDKRNSTYKERFSSLQNLVLIMVIKKNFPFSYCKIYSSSENVLSIFSVWAKGNSFFTFLWFYFLQFEDDKVLIPKETSWFGYYPCGGFKPVLPPQKVFQKEMRLLLWLTSF